MPLSLPNLDDRRYPDLVEEARSLIPSYAPEWTNHNPSDPGITLIELFAYLSEILVYRVNRVTDDNIRAFLKLITGAKADESQPLDAEIRAAVLDLRRTVRAVTVEDYERLAVAAHEGAARARCLPLRNLETPAPFAQESPGHVSIVVVSGKTEADAAYMQDMLTDIKQDLEPRKLLTTRLHVVAPRWVTLRLKITLVLTQGALESAETGETEEMQQKGVVELAVEALREFFDALRGGPERRGWPFGRSIYVSEIYALLDGLPGVDYVSHLTPSISVPPRAGQAADDQSAARQRLKDGELYAFALEPDELIDIEVNASDITAQRPQVELK
ncbi:MAG TPA: baseplate J/gp47 family protein [Pyrinomonadaceae bacterium]|nr:baseplate J/gp47 family protein [Pyrinomonadaceae bacterium]